MDTLNYLWIEGDLPRLQRCCLKSMLRLGYKINFWTTTLSQININNPNITFKDANTILEYNKQNRLHYADLFRYKLLYELGGTWCDADLFLFKKLPNDEIIISSEHCKKTGAFSKQHTDKTPNIGILRLPAKDLFLYDVIRCCERTKSNNLTDISFMQFFNKKINKYHYDKYVVDPEVYCPVSWANASELYCSYKGFKERWGIKQNDFETMKNNSIGIHLWNNIYRNKGYKIEEGSIIRVLEDIVADIELTDYYIAIPTYKRKEILNNKTLAMLDKYNIDKNKINIFVENEEQYCDYNDSKYNFIITNTKGIGAKRKFMKNYFANGENILMIDDDVEDLILKNYFDFVLNDFIVEAFKIAKIENVSLWGVCLYDNVFFLKDTITTNLKFIGGTFQGIRINDSSRSIVVDIDHFEDIENSLLHFLKEGKTLRFNFMGLRTKYYQPTGGICADKGGVDKREEEALINATYLMGMYSDYISVYAKKDGKINIRLKGGG